MQNCAELGFFFFFLFCRIGTLLTIDRQSITTGHDRFIKSSRPPFIVVFSTCTVHHTTTQKLNLVKTSVHLYPPILQMRNNYFLTALLYLLLVGQPISSINVALHAQAKYSEHGWVAGSEVTTAGIKNALVQYSQISKVHIFAPFSYITLNDTMGLGHH